jgi:hypothetical protein
LADELDGGIAASGLMGQDTETVQAVGVLRVELENPAVGALGFSQPAGRVELERGVEKPVGQRYRRLAARWRDWNLATRLRRTPFFAVHYGICPRNFRSRPMSPGPA